MDGVGERFADHGPQVPSFLQSLDRYLLLVDARWRNLQKSVSEAQLFHFPRSVNGQPSLGGAHQEASFLFLSRGIMKTENAHLVRERQPSGSRKGGEPITSYTIPAGCSFAQGKAPIHVPDHLRSPALRTLAVTSPTPRWKSSTGTSHHLPRPCSTAVVSCDQTLIGLRRPTYRLLHFSESLAQEQLQQLQRQSIGHLNTPLCPPRSVQPQNHICRNLDASYTMLLFQAPA